jgi:hypothetical protein
MIAQSKSLTSGHVSYELLHLGRHLQSTRTWELNLMFLTQPNFRIVEPRGRGYADIIVRLID